MNKARALIIAITLLCAAFVSGKFYVEEKLLALVQEELTDEIGCDVSVSELSLSFLRPNLNTSNFKIRCADEAVGMHAESVTASVVLGQLFEKRVIIDSIGISALTMDAFPSKGAFYETIKWASAPIGSSNPDRWIIKVNGISIDGLSEAVRFIQDDNALTLGDPHATIKLKRDLPGIPVAVRLFSREGVFTNETFSSALQNINVKLEFAARAEVQQVSMKTEYGLASVGGWVDVDTLDHELFGSLSGFELNLNGQGLSGDYLLQKDCYQSKGGYSEKGIVVLLSSEEGCPYEVSADGSFDFAEQTLVFEQAKFTARRNELEGQFESIGTIGFSVEDEKLFGQLKTVVKHPDALLVGNANLASEVFDGRLVVSEIELPANILLRNREEVIATISSVGSLQAKYNLLDELLNVSASKFSLNFIEQVSGSLSFTLDEKELEIEPFNLRVFGNDLSSLKPVIVSVNGDRAIIENQEVLVANRPVAVNGEVLKDGTVDLELSGSSRFQRTILSSESFISAQAKGSLQVQGAIDEPSIFGKVFLSDIDGTYSYLDSALVFENASTEVTFTDHEIVLNDFIGSINSGTFSGDGRVKLENLSPVEGAFTLDLADINLAPLSGVSLALDGQLLLQLAQSVYSLSGNLDVTKARVRRDISWRDILGFFVDRKKARRGSGVSEVIPIELSVNVGLQELLVEAAVLVAELVGDVQVGGSTLDPSLSGEVVANGGQISFSSYPFEIVSGRVFFDNSVPQLEVLGETSIPSTELGEEEIVWLSISGAAETPRISLRSELGSDERTLLARISSGATGSGLTLVSNDNSQPLLELFDPTTSDSIGSRLSSLVNFEEVRIETNFSSEEGRLDPWLAASRPLIEDFSLSVKSSLAGSTSGEASVEYYLAPELSVIAGWQSTLVTQRANTDGAGVIGLRTEQRFPGESLFPAFEFSQFSELSGAEVLSNISVDGNRRFSDQEIVRLSSLTRGTFLSEGALSGARNRILEEYASEGFMFAGLSYQFNKRFKGNLTNVEFLVEEGEPVRIESLVVLGERLPFLSGHFDDILGKVRSEALIASWKQRALEILRNNEYYFARFATELDGGELTIRVIEGEQVKLVFNGANYFSRSDLIEVLELDDRNTPVPAKLGSYIEELLRNVYQDEGFLQVLIETERTASEIVVSIDEGEQYLVEQLVVDGVSEKLQLRLLSQLESSPYPGHLLSYFISGVAELSILEQDRSTLQNYLRSIGYKKATVSLKMDYVGADRVQVNYDVSLGKKVTIEEDMCDYDHGLKSKFSEKLKKEGERRISNKLAEKGYPLAQAELSVTDSKLHCEVRRGPKVVVSKIIFEGVNEKRAEEIVSKFIKPGDYWSEKLIGDSVAELVSSGGFSRIEMRPFDGKLDEESETLLVKYSLRETGSLRLGGGFSTEEGILISGQLAQRNFYGSGNTFGIGVDGAFLNDGRFLDAGTARAFYSFPPNLRVEAFGQFEIEFNNDFSYDRVGAAIKSDYRIGESLEITPELVYSVEDVFDVPSEQLIGANDFGTTAYLEPYLGLRYDLRDDVFNTSKGLEARLSVSAASSDLGSDVDLLSAYSRLSGWVPVSQRITLGASVSGEIIQPYGETDVVPLRRRLFLGGRGSVRGFSPNSLSPRASTGRPVGGDSSLQGSVELSLGLSEDLHLLTFLDVGQAFLRNEGSFDGEDKDLDDLRFSPGLGFRYKTPVGPISVEYGLALDREFGEGFGRLFFGVGNSF